MVTVSVDRINFLTPVRSGSLVEIIANIEKVSNVKVEIKVAVYAEEPYTNKKVLAIDTSFTFAAVNEDNSPTRLFDN